MQKDLIDAASYWWGLGLLDLATANGFILALDSIT